MKMTGLAVSMGLGIAAGAVGVLMLNGNNPARKLANKAAQKAEDAVTMATDKLTGQ